jgi:uncharacterized membrane protein YphA (DoxX/SURF4 family)
MVRWTFWTVFFLVLLRLSIGWHFLFEGLNKVHSYMVGPTVTSKPFTSGPYFREAPGPLGTLFRATTGDADDNALARLVPRPRPVNDDPARDKAFDRLPPGLRADWRDLVDRYVKHYIIADNEAQAALDQHAEITVRWLEYQPPALIRDIIQRFGKVENVDESLLNDEEKAAYKEFVANSTDQTLSFATGEVTRRMTMAERVQHYREKLADYRDRAGRKAWLFGKDVDASQLRGLKAELAQWRNAMLTDLQEQQTARLVMDLNQKALGKVGEELAALKGTGDLLKMPGTPIDLVSFHETAQDLATRWTTENRKADAESVREILKTLPKKEALPPPPPDPLVGWIDFLTIWGLTIMGGCILVGFLTRLHCWAAAGFLLMTYLAVPSWPWLPAVGPQEGNYFLVNKNVVEMFALCVLGTLPTGRWFGADGLLLALWNFLFGSSEEETN